MEERIVSVKRTTEGDRFADITWKITDYSEWYKACPAGSVRSFGVFNINFDNNEIYQFELEIRPEEDPEDSEMRIINRNGFNVNISIGPVSDDPITSGCVSAWRALKIPQLCNIYDSDNDLLDRLFVQFRMKIEESGPTANNPWQRLLSDKTFTDFVITCGDETSIDCHRAILANKSTVFRSFFERHNKDNKSYEISDFEPEIVKQMIHFIYTNELPEDAKQTEALLHIGDKYDVEGLVTLCATKLAKVLDAETAIGWVSLLSLNFSLKNGHFFLKIGTETKLLGVVIRLEYTQDSMML
jgi:hypothetical protein